MANVLSAGERVKGKGLRPAELSAKKYPKVRDLGFGNADCGFENLDKYQSGWIPASAGMTVASQ